MHNNVTAFLTCFHSIFIATNNVGNTNVGRDHQTFLVVYVELEQNNHIKSSLIIERFIYLSQTKSRCQLSRAGTVSSQLLGALAVSSFQCLSSQCTTVHCTVSTTTYSDPGSALIPITQPASSLQSEGRGRDEEDGGKSLRLYFLQGAPHQLPYDTCIPPNTTQSGGHTQVQGRLRMQSFFFSGSLHNK